MFGDPEQCGGRRNRLHERVVGRGGRHRTVSAVPPGRQASTRPLDHQLRVCRNIPIGWRHPSQMMRWGGGVETYLLGLRRAPMPAISCAAICLTPVRGVNAQESHDENRALMRERKATWRLSDRGTGRREARRRGSNGKTPQEKMGQRKRFAPSMPSQPKTGHDQGRDLVHQRAQRVHDHSSVPPPLPGAPSRAVSLPCLDRSPFAASPSIFLRIREQVPTPYLGILQPARRICSTQRD